MSDFRPYPLALNVQGKPCLVVGGGPVARRKVEGLLRCGAQVTVVAPIIDPALSRLSSDRLKLVVREFLPADADHATLVFACTDSPEVNARVGEAARAAGSLFNRADRADMAEECDFAGMSAIERGHLLIAVSTSSDSPAFARWLREQISAEIGPEHGELLEIAASLRDEMKQTAPSEALGDAWQQAFQSDALALLRRGDRAGAVEAFREALIAARAGEF